MSDWPAIIVRFALYADLMILFGLSSFSLYSLRAAERAGALRLRPWLVASAAAGLALSVVALAIMAAAMAGVAPSDVDRESVDAIVTGGAIGWAWQVRMAALVAALLMSLRAAPGTWRLAAIALAGGVALASLPWAGHGAAGEGGLGWVQLGADIVHLIAAGTWLGALIGLGLLIWPAKRRGLAHLELTHRALHGFGAVGTLVVAALLLSGLVNSWVLVGPAQIGGLASDPYGRLLLAKLALFGAMLALAAINRFRLTPWFRSAIDSGDSRAAASVLKRSMALETMCAIAILALVAWLGTLPPPASALCDATDNGDDRRASNCA